MTNMRAMLEIVIVAAVGALAGIAVDYATSRGAALVFRASDILDHLTDFRLPPLTSLLFALIALVVFGGASVFYVRPLGRKGAFGCGFCAIAVLTMLAP